MTKFIKTFCFISFLGIVSCTDSMQTGQKILSIIEEQNLTTLVLQIEQSDGNIQVNEYPINKIEIDHQFVKLGNEYVSLRNAKRLKVSENTIVVSL